MLEAVHSFVITIELWISILMNSSSFVVEMNDLLSLSLKALFFIYSPVLGQVCEELEKEEEKKERRE